MNWTSLSTGSREFTEEYKKKLVDRGVVYINSDTAVSGPIMFAEASPTISKKVIEAAKRVPYMDDSYASYFDFWKEWLDTGMIFLRNHWNKFQKKFWNNLEPKLFGILLSIDPTFASPIDNKTTNCLSFSNLVFNWSLTHNSKFIIVVEYESLSCPIMGV